MHTQLLTWSNKEPEKMFLLIYLMNFTCDLINNM